MTTTYGIFLTIGLLVTMVTVYLLYGRQLQIIRKLRSLHPTATMESELERKLREADIRIEASMGRIRNIRGETRKTWDSLQEKSSPAPTRQQAPTRPQALTALHAIASGANDIREQYQDIETIRDALNRLPADA
jgi:hypothetical protein